MILSYWVSVTFLGRSVKLRGGIPPWEKEKHLLKNWLGRDIMDSFPRKVLSNQQIWGHQFAGVWQILHHAFWEPNKNPRHYRYMSIYDWPYAFIYIYNILYICITCIYSVIFGDLNYHFRMGIQTTPYQLVQENLCLSTVALLLPSYLAGDFNPSQKY